MKNYNGAIFLLIFINVSIIVSSATANSNMKKNIIGDIMSDADKPRDCDSSITENNSLLKAFKAEVNNFYTSVAERNWDVFIGYINQDLDFYAQLPGGIVIESASDFLENQKSWFNGNTGSFKFEVVDTQNSENSRWVSFANIVYKNIDENGVLFEKNIGIELEFSLIGSNWYLVRDINTLRDTN